MQGEEHWKSLKDIIFEYANHPESKFENGNQKGLMKRRFIFNGKLVYIGKEVKNLEEQALKVPKPEQYFNEDELKKKILAMTPNEAREKGIKHRSTLKRLKDRINKEKKIKFNNKTFNRLAEIK